MEDKIIIVDFDSWNQDKLGIFLYDERIYNPEDINEVKSYLFKLKIMYRKDWVFNDNTNTNIFNEDINFIHICNLSQYIKTKIFSPGTVHHELYDGEEGKDVIIKNFDYKKLLMEIIPEEYIFCIERVIRKKSKTIPAPVIFTEDFGANGNYGKGEEFLQLDDKSSFHGNFKQNNKEGCLITCGENSRNKNRNLSNIFKINPENSWNFYNLHFEIKKDLEKLHGNNIANIIYNWTNQQKLEYFQSLSIYHQSYIVENYLKTYLNDLKERNFYPYRIWLWGTDDDSWSKWFPTEEEMLEEVNWLRKMQPINKIKDVCQRDYHFTN